MLCFPEHRSQDIRTALILASAQAVTNLPRGELLQRPEAFGEFGEQRRAGWRDEFVRFADLRHGYAACAQDFKRSRRRKREGAVGALDRANALDHWTGQNARLAQFLECNAGTHNVDDRIDGANFMEVDLFRRMAMDFSLGPGDAVKDRDGLFLYPWRKAAGGY
jgi:hypothetical protein